MIHLSFVDLDHLFNTLKYTPVVINDLDVTNIEEKEYLNSLLYTRYEGDSLDVMPSCDCGQVRGQVNEDIVCTECGTPCAPVTEKPLESMLWVRTPENIHGFVNPVAWMILSSYLTVSGCNILEWLTDPFYIPSLEKATKVVHHMEAMGIPRGLNHFIDNFDDIMDTLFRNNIIRGSVQVRKEFQQFIRENKRYFFPKHLPVPSRLSFILESTNTGVYAETRMATALDAIRTISSLSTSLTPLRQNRLESRVVRSIAQLASYHWDFFVNSLAPKEAWLRKHVYGSRLHFTARAVISSLSENHDYEELHLPWGVGVQLLKQHLSNKLLRRGYTPKQIQEMFYCYARTYHPLLDELFQELIEESPYKGLPVILQRNPTLQRGSAQQFYVTRIKPDPMDYTISMSVLTLAAPNADEVGLVA